MTNKQKIRTSRIVKIVVLLIFVIGIVIVALISKSQWEDLRLVKSRSSLIQVHLWAAEYKKENGKYPDSFDDLMGICPSDASSGEYDQLIRDYNDGKVGYFPNASSDEILIRWDRSGHVIEATCYGSVRIASSGKGR